MSENEQSATERSSPIELLRWQTSCGVNLALEDQPVDRFLESERETGEARPRQPTGSEATPPQKTGVAAGKPAVIPGAAAAHSARELAKAATSIPELHEAMASFEGCNLRRTARNLVFADGDPASRIMAVGEAPGRDEDEQGLPFVGRSGQLFNRMLAAIGLERSDVYIANVIPWRPPGNRTPTPAETEICKPFIERHIELANPQVLVMLGGASAKALLNTTEGILSMRGTWRTAQFGKVEIEALPTLHPAYLLRQPAQKALAWRDMLSLKARLEARSQDRANAK